MAMSKMSIELPSPYRKYKSSTCSEAASGRQSVKSVSNHEIAVSFRLKSFCIDLILL